MNGQTEEQERITRLGAPLTDDDLWDIGQRTADPGDYDLDQSPRQGETFEQWRERVKA